MSKETREIAGEVALALREKIATTGFDIAEAINAIDKALRDRDERAAKIADAKAEVYRCKSQEQATRDGSLSEHFLAECNAALEVATAIRNGVADAE